MIPPAGSPAEPDDPDQPELDAGQQDLEDRHALRRVAGLSTELQDVTEVEYRELRLERVVLMGVWTDGTPVSYTHLDVYKRQAPRRRRPR